MSDGPAGVPSEDLATVGAGAVLAALGAGAVRQVPGTAGRVGARHQRRRDGLPLRATVPRVAARHLPLRNSHGVLLWSFAWTACWVVLVSRRIVPVSATAGPAVRPTWGRPVRRDGGPDHPRAWRRTARTGQDSPPGTTAGTAGRAPPRPAAAVRGRAGHPPAGRRPRPRPGSRCRSPGRRTAPGSRPRPRRGSPPGTARTHPRAGREPDP